MPKIIAYCLFKYFAHGGLQRDMLRIALACQQAGAAIRVYTMQWDGPQPEGFDVRIVPTRGLTNHGRAKQFAAQVKRLLAADPVALVVGYNRMPGLDVYFGSDVCFAQAIRSRNPLYLLTPRCRTYLAMERAVFSADSNTHILLISSQQVKDYKKHYELSDDRFTLLPPGLDNTFRLAEDPAQARRRIRAAFAVRQDDFLILLVGSAFKTKGVDRAIHAIADLPDSLRSHCVFVVAGQGKEAPYRRLANRLGIGPQLHLAGVRHDIPALMAAADVLIHPARVENTGLTLLEALASDLPVLCTAACGYAPYITDAKGGVVLDEPFSQSKMNAALQTMLEPRVLSRYRTAIADYRRKTPLGGLVQRAAEVIMERLR